MKRQGLRVRLVAGLAGLSACLCACGAATPSVRAQPSEAEAATRALANLRRRAAESNQPVVAIVHARWCGPCNELETRVLDTPEGKQLMQHTIVLPIDFEDAVGGAVSARLRVIGLPTTLVLRVEGDRLREYGRVEGFETAPEYRLALQTALERTAPAKAGCDNADDRALAPLADARTLLPDLDCSATRLQSEEPGDAADKIRTLLTDPAFAKTGTGWSEDERGRLADFITILGRYDSRVARQSDLCADDFARLAAWPGLPEKRKPGAVFWHARCLNKAGRSAEALNVLTNWLSGRADDPAAKELVADLLVHEHLELARARQLLLEVVKVKPENDWAWYLLGEVATQQGDTRAAIEHLRKADLLKPGVALYVRHLAQLRSPTSSPERVVPAVPATGDKP